MDKTWVINSTCDRVHIWSHTLSQVEECFDFLTIGDRKFTGNMQISTIVDVGVFNVKFESDSTISEGGFELFWE